MRSLLAVLVLAACGSPGASRVRFSESWPGAGMGRWYHVDGAQDNGETFAFLSFAGLPDGGSVGDLHMAVRVPAASQILVVNGITVDAGPLGVGTYGSRRSTLFTAEAADAGRTVAEAAMKGDVIEIRRQYSAEPIAVLDGGQPQRMREVLEAYRGFGGAW